MILCAKNFCNTQGWFYVIDITTVSFFFSTSAERELCVAGVIDSCREGTCVGISARDKSMLKWNHHQIIQFTVLEDRVPQLGLFKGWLNGLKVGYIRRVLHHIINEITKLLTVLYWQFLIHFLFSLSQYFAKKGSKSNYGAKTSRKNIPARALSSWVQLCESMVLLEVIFFLLFSSTTARLLFVSLHAVFVRRCWDADQRDAE